jgi:ABC-type antimicrobial peptide transport system permease subunit
MLTILLIGGFIFLCKRVQKGDIKVGGFTFIVLGMVIGLLGGFQVFFWIDSTKGWNPYGWWFIATFITMVIGGLTGVIVFGRITRENNKQA